MYLHRSLMYTHTKTLFPCFKKLTKLEYLFVLAHTSHDLVVEGNSRSTCIFLDFFEIIDALKGCSTVGVWSHLCPTMSLTT